ncbi:LysR family transcriptional regulator [Sphingomonas sanguinis]|uniref:LysR family transcriptional regulator n=1 Tax=Sphingomonas sanguinis TaxID=33051 RepID=UPI002ACD4E9E|nr:LysR family transcriptional regulator [Sphingomonas sanguinis]
MASNDRSTASENGGAGPADDVPVRRLNLNLLYPLDAILHAPTLTEAGRRVSLSQSAMSHALRRLRDHFSDDLVIHGAGEAHLTPLGQALRPEVRRIMREVEGAFNYSIAFDPLTTTETITIAANDTNEQMLLGPVLRSLSTLAPGLQVNVMPLDIERPARSLELGADLLLLSGDMAVEGLETMPILTDRVSCLVWDRHPEFQDRLGVTEAQYRAARHIVARGGETTAFALDQNGIDMLRARRICVRTTSQATLPAILIGSDLVATGSSWVFQNYASIMPLKVLEAPFARRDIVLVAQWPRNRHDPMLGWFVRQVKGYFAQHYKV